VMASLSILKATSTFIQKVGTSISSNSASTLYESSSITTWKLGRLCSVRGEVSYKRRTGTVQIITNGTFRTIF
jgi:hypothetical protein